MTKTFRTIGSAILILTALGCTPGSSGPRDEPDLGTPPSCPRSGQVAVDEVCNAFDDDCDGIMDEGICDDPCGAFDERPL